MRFGGVRDDLPDGFAEQCKKDLPYMKSRIEEFIEFFAQDPVYHARMENIGSISPETAKRIGCSGPVLRAAGVPYDMRTEDPILVYPDLDFKVITGTRGDSADRIDVRMRRFWRAFISLSSVSIEFLRTNKDRGQDPEEGSRRRGLLPC